MRQVKYLAALLAAGLCLTACGPKETNDVYVCGNTADGHAFYAFNGQFTELGAEYDASHVSAMKVVDGDVYCVGHVVSRRAVNNGLRVQGSGFVQPEAKEQKQAVLWKNGTEVFRERSFDFSYFTDFVFVNDTAVYCVGAYSGQPKKEAEFQYSTDYNMVQYSMAAKWGIDLSRRIPFIWGSLTDGNHWGEACGACMDGDVLHIVGYDNGTRGRTIGTLDHYFSARHWQASKENPYLVEEVFDHSSQATAVFATKGGLYILGWNDDDLQSSGGQDALYRQGEWVKTLPDCYEVFLTCGFSCGTDLYFCGYATEGSYDIPCAVYYKNGQKVKLAGEGQNGKSAIYAACTRGADVYMAGYMNDKPGYWKNGKFVPLQGKDGAELTGIAVFSKTNPKN